MRYALDQGHTVFMVSWRNVRADQGPAGAQFTWDDYLEKGIFRAFEAAREIARSERVNALGFCIGGTLLGAALAVLAGRKQDCVASATYLTTMLDFSEPGQLGVFIDAESIARREAELGAGGIFPGADLANVFFQFLKAEPEETAKLAALHARGRTLQRVIRLLEDATQARSRAQAIEEQRREAERLMEAHKTHNARRRSAADTARAMAETTE